MSDAGSHTAPQCDVKIFKTFRTPGPVGRNPYYQPPPAFQKGPPERPTTPLTSGLVASTFGKVLYIVVMSDDKLTLHVYKGAARGKLEE